VALESCIATLDLRQEIAAFFPVLTWHRSHEGNVAAALAAVRPIPDSKFSFMPLPKAARAVSVRISF
jgi:hypothetical protein